MKIPLQFTVFKSNNVAMLRAKFSEFLCTCEAQVCPNRSSHWNMPSLFTSNVFPTASARQAHHCLFYPTLGSKSFSSPLCTKMNLLAHWFLSITNLSTYILYYSWRTRYKASDALYAIYWTTTPEVFVCCQCANHQTIERTHPLPVNLFLSLCP
jgi:hypothetical protein